jgi:hypothetical protein
MLILLVTTLIASFGLILKEHYTFGFIIGGVFLYLATSLGQWFSNKNEDYVHRNIYENNRDRWHN